MGRQHTTQCGPHEQNMEGRTDVCVYPCKYTALGMRMIERSRSKPGNCYGLRNMDVLCMVKSPVEDSTWKAGLRKTRPKHAGLNHYSFTRLGAQICGTRNVAHGAAWRQKQISPQAPFLWHCCSCPLCTPHCKRGYIVCRP